MIDDVVRRYSLTLCVLVIVAGTAQARRWRGFTVGERLHWQSTALFNLAALIGTAEALAAGHRGGVRVYLVAIAVTWLLVAVLHRPVTQWRAHRHRTEESP